MIVLPVADLVRSARVLAITRCVELGFTIPRGDRRLIEDHRTPACFRLVEAGRVVLKIEAAKSRLLSRALSGSQGALVKAPVPTCDLEWRSKVAKAVDQSP